MAITKQKTLNTNGHPSQFEYVVVATLCVIAFLSRMRNLNSPISGTYSFRTTQTAWGIRSFLDGKYSPFDIEMPVLGPPWKVPFEFPLFQMVAGLLAKVFGASVESSGRIVSTCFFVATGVVVYLISRKFCSRTVSIVVLTIFLFNAHGLEYGSAVLIEYCALFFSFTAFFLLTSLHKNLNSRKLAWFIALSVVAGLVKVTTSFVWVVLGSIAAGVITLAPFRRWLTLVVVAITTQIPALIWTRWADEVKGASPTTEWLTSRQLSDWTFGSLSQRFSWYGWKNSLLDLFIPSVVGGLQLPILLLLFTVALQRRSRELLALVSLFFAGPVVFTNLYFVHEYYWVSVLPAFLMLLALGLEECQKFLVDRTHPDNFRGQLIGGFVAIAIVLASWSSPQGSVHFDVWNRAGSYAYDDQREEIAIDTISNFTKSEDKVILIGQDWNPRILYFANRKGLMIPSAVNPEFLLNSPDLGSLYEYVYFYFDPSPETISALFGDKIPTQVVGNLYRF